MLKHIVCIVGNPYFSVIKKRRLDKSKVKKILFIKSGAIGDVLMTTPLVRAVKEHFPKAEIVYCIGKWSQGVLKNNKNIDRIVSFDEKIIFKKKLLGLKKLANKLSKEKFDLCFVLDWSYLAGLFGYMCAPNATRVGFSRNKEGFAHTIGVPYGDEKHDSEYYLDLARAIGAGKEASSARMELFPSKEDNDFASSFMKKNRIKGKIVGIAPGGAYNPGQTVPLKRWPEKKYIELCASILNKTKANIIFFGGKTDKVTIKSVMFDAKAKEHCRMHDAHGITILQSSALMKKCNVFVTNDSGPMHMAAAMNVQVISIFGPTNPKKLAPLGKQHKIFQSKLDCVPCYKNGSYPKCSHKKCMQAVKADDVFNEIKKVI